MNNFEPWSEFDEFNKKLLDDFERQRLKPNSELKVGDVIYIQGKKFTVRITYPGKDIINPLDYGEAHENKD